MLKLTILGHASLMFESGPHRVLMDPVLRTTPLIGTLVHQLPRTLDLSHMPAPTMLIITHAHFDHYDIETLERLPHDIPIVIPRDKRMVTRLGQIGFQDIRQVGDWESVEHGDLRFVATPSDAPVTEFGLIAASPDGVVWHMSDAEPPAGIAERVRREFGEVDFVSAKFQPADPQLNFHHNLGSHYDRRAVAQWLETAAACEPRLVMAYASGLCFEGERSWLNQVAYPFSPQFVAGVLARRLGDRGRVGVAHPGDVLMIGGSRVQVCEQESPFVRQAAPATDTRWLPFDPRHFAGELEPQARQALVRDLEEILLGADFRDWLQRQSTGNSAPLRNFREWGVIAQFTVRDAAGEAWDCHVDFGGDTPRVQVGYTDDAAYFMHIHARAAAQMVAGQATSLRSMIGGHVFVHERLVTVRDGRIDAPQARLIYEDFPDPLLTFLGTRKPAATSR